MTPTAVVILNYNGEDYLRRFLPSVLTHSGNAEIIVADNQSNDRSVEVLTNEFPTVRIIQLDKNHGYAGGYNHAIAKVSAEYIVLLNSDVEVTEGWLSPLVTFLDQNPAYAACQPKIKDYNDPARFEYAGASGGYVDRLGYPYCRGRIFDSIENDQSQYDEEADIFWTSGACMLVRREVFVQSGGLDPDFFAHMEEIDLCWRFRSMGFKLRSIPTASVFHVGGGTLSKLSPLKTYLNFRNGLFMLLKNLPLTTLLMIFPIRILLDWIAAIKFILEGSPRHGISVWKAHLKMLAAASKMIKKRKVFSKTDSRKAIVFDYYLKNKRKFDEI